MNVGDTPILPICAPGTSNFEKCRNRFLGICMFQNNFEDDILFRDRENLKKLNVRDTPFLPLKIIFLKSLSQHTHTDISSKFHVSNFNSQDILFYIYNTPILPLCPLELRISKKAEIGFQVFVCSRTISKTIPYFTVEKLSKT